jgi:hypothetical protein
MADTKTLTGLAMLAWFQRNEGTLKSIGGTVPAILTNLYVPPTTRGTRGWVKPKVAFGEYGYTTTTSWQMIELSIYREWKVQYTQ